MKNMCRGLAAMLVLTLLVDEGIAQPGRFGGRQGGRPGSSGQNSWIMDYEQGRELARKTGKPMMVVFRCVP
jgi:hypothetical protein